MNNKGRDGRLVVSIRVRPELKAKIERRAAREDRSVTKCVERILDKTFKEKPETASTQELAAA
jgi:hypothetical protein